MSDHLPPPHTLLQKIGRQALIGVTASCVSDTISNSLRVRGTLAMPRTRSLILITRSSKHTGKSMLQQFRIEKQRGL